MTDYKATLNLPSTAFPMKAGLPQREPEIGTALTCTGSCGRSAKVARNSSCMTARRTPTATFTSVMR